MLMKVVLWAILVGSIVMGYLGYRSGSATNAAIGIGIFLLSGFALFFLLKVLFHFGFLVVKILLFLGLIALIVLSGVKGCQYLTGQGRKVNQEQVAEVQSFESDIESKGLLERAMSFFSLSKNGMPQATDNNTKKSPKQAKKRRPVKTLPATVEGVITEIRSGYPFKIDNHFIKLYGIDAPDPQQTCLNERGEDFDCGHVAKLMLERLTMGRATQCQVVGGDFKGNYIATCRLKNVDVGASMVMAGWAVADRDATHVYIPYEEEAHRNRMGLWAGKFVAPWQERTSRIRKAEKGKAPVGFWESLLK